MRSEIESPVAGDVRLRLFLEILSASCGEADASDYRWNWINAFCSGHEEREPDTFNMAADAGYTTVSHDSDTDSGIVRLTDAGRAYLAASPTPDSSAADDVLARHVVEVIEEDGGCWTACSGCQESDEGYVSEKYYPYSPIFRCQPGGGCSECGGIGVIWQDGAYLASWGNGLSPDSSAVSGSAEVEIAYLRKALAFCESEARIANRVIAEKKSGRGQGKIRVATALHRIEHHAEHVRPTLTEVQQS